MVTRVTGAELKEIIDTQKDDGLLESQFIDTAHLFVEENLVSGGLSEAVLKKIELYLAAHFLAVTEERGGLVVEHVGEATNRYADVYSEGGFHLTRYGQTAVAMDTTNTLIGFTNKQKARLTVI